MHGDPAPGVNTGTQPGFRFAREMGQPIHVPDPNGDVRRKFQIDRRSAPADASDASSNKTKSTVGAAQTVGFAGGEVGFSPDASLRAAGNLLGPEKAILLTDIWRYGYREREASLEHGLFDAPAVLGFQMGQPTPVTIPFLGFVVNSHSLSGNKANEKIAGGQRRGFGGFPVLAQFRSIDSDQSDLATVNQDDRIAINDVAYRLVFMSRSRLGRFAMQQSRRDSGKCSKRKNKQGASRRLV